MRTDVSIVIPVYKVPETLLRKCVESCIQQDKREIEIILVDDCSPDNCGAICDKLAEIDNRIHVIHKEKNGGLSAARNTGVKAANGEWITFVDGDDWIDPDTCSLVDKINDPDIELIVFGSIREYEKGSEPFLLPYDNGRIYDKKECRQLQLDILDYSKRLSTAYGKIVKLSFLKDKAIYHDPEVRCGVEGIEYNLRLFGALNKAIVFSEYKYHYVYNLESITGAPSDVINQFVLIGLEKMRTYVLSLDNHKELYQQFEKRVQRVITDTGIGCYFNPNYKLTYRERKAMYARFCKNPVIAEVMLKPCTERSKSKRIIYYCAQHRLHFVLLVLGWMRIKILSTK